MADRPLDLEPVKKCLQSAAPWNQVFKILHDFLQPHSTKSVPTAADQIDGHTPMKGRELNDAECEQFLWHFWKLIVEFARAIPYDHPSQERLVLLVIKLTEKMHPIIKIHGRDTRFWTDLPLLDKCMKEVRYDHKPDQPLSEESARKLISWNSFAARLQGVRLVNWEIYALWAFRDALETTTLARPIVNCYVIAATEWINHSGHALFKCLDVKKLDGDTSNGTLYQGKTGMSRERWDFWKNRFRDVREKVDDDVKLRATAAARAMDSIEAVQTPLAGHRFKGCSTVF